MVWPWLCERWRRTLADCANSRYCRPQSRGHEGKREVELEPYWKRLLEREGGAVKGVSLDIEGLRDTGVEIGIGWRPKGEHVAGRQETSLVLEHAEGRIGGDLLD